MFEPQPGGQVGRYEIQRQVGRGGMGSVYVAHDPILGRLVAIKVFSGDLVIPDARERFEREARAAAALAHPHITRVYDFGEYESQPYIVMEYLPGETLAEVIRRKQPLPLDLKLRWMEELAAAVGYAHKAEVIHRDIKPANLIIDRERRVKVLDFGIARMLRIASNTKDMIGTPGYMAPEQILSAPVDGRADLFSVGVVFYELLAYAEAFPGDNLPAITHSILTTDPVPLDRLVPDLHPDVPPIVERALRKSVDERFSDAESLRDAISRVRRRLAEDPGVTIVAPGRLRRDTPDPGPRPGTGSAKQPSSGVVVVATPPPTGPEALARRRNTLIQAALAQARVLLSSGDLEMALAACQQALIYDEQHIEALELDRHIRLAFVKRETTVPRADLVAPGGEISASAGAEDNLAATVLAPSRGTPSPFPPAPPLSTPTPTPFHGPDRPAQSTPTSPGSSSPPVTAHVRLRRWGAFGAALIGPVRAIAHGAYGRVARGAYIPRTVGRKAAIAVSAGVVVVILAVLIARASRPVAVPPSGTLVVDAVPWGIVTAIEAEHGERQPLTSPASTPLVLSLPAGNYQVVIEGPAPESDVQRISVRIDPNVATTAPPIRFRVITPEEYFEPYVALQPEPAVAADGSVPQPPAATTIPASAPPVSPSGGVSP